MLKIKSEVLTSNNELTQVEIVSDLLYTMFQCMDEYVEYKIQHGTPREEITRMKYYVEKEIRKYAKGVYEVEVEDT